MKTNTPTAGDKRRKRTLKEFLANLILRAAAQQAIEKAPKVDRYPYPVPEKFQRKARLRRLRQFGPNNPETRAVVEADYARRPR